MADGVGEVVALAPPSKLGQPDSVIFRPVPSMLRPGKLRVLAVSLKDQALLSLVFSFVLVYLAALFALAPKPPDDCAVAAMAQMSHGVAQNARYLELVVFGLAAGSSVSHALAVPDASGGSLRVVLVASSAVFAMQALTYAAMALQWTHAYCWWPSADGRDDGSSPRVVAPLRYIYWAFSNPCVLASIGYLIGMPVWQLVRASLVTALSLLLGLGAELVPLYSGGWWTCIILAFAGTVCVMWAAGRIYAAGLRHAQVHRDRTRYMLQAFLPAILLVWCAFPVVFMCAELGGMTPLQEMLVTPVLDGVAKILLCNLTIALANMYQRADSAVMEKLKAQQFAADVRRDASRSQMALLLNFASQLRLPLASLQAAAAQAHAELSGEAAAVPMVTSEETETTAAVATVAAASTPGGVLLSGASISGTSALGGPGAQGVPPGAPATTTTTAVPGAVAGSANTLSAASTDVPADHVAAAAAAASASAAAAAAASAAAAAAAAVGMTGVGESEREDSRGGCFPTGTGAGAAHGLASIELVRSNAATMARIMEDFLALHRAAAARTAMEQSLYTSLSGFSGFNGSYTINTLAAMTSAGLDPSSLRLGRFSLRPLVEQTVQGLQGFAVRRGITVLVSLGTSLPDMMVGDEARLRFVLMALLARSLQLCPRGGRLEVRAVLIGHHPVPLRREPEPGPGPGAGAATAVTVATNSSGGQRTITGSPTPTQMAAAGPNTTGSHQHQQQQHPLQQPPALPPLQQPTVTTQPVPFFRFSCGDDGVGISAEAAATLFEPYSDDDGPHSAWPRGSKKVGPAPATGGMPPPAAAAAPHPPRRQGATSEYIAPPTGTSAGDTEDYAGGDGDAGDSGGGGAGGGAGGDTSVEEGVGMLSDVPGGMYICRAMAEAMGGRVGVESVHGLGTMLYAELPGFPTESAMRKAAAAVSAAAAAAAAPSPGLSPAVPPTAITVAPGPGASHNNPVPALKHPLSAAAAAAAAATPGTQPANRTPREVSFAPGPGPTAAAPGQARMPQQQQHHQPLPGAAVSSANSANSGSTQPTTSPPRGGADREDREDREGREERTMSDASTISRGTRMSKVTVFTDYRTVAGHTGRSAASHSTAPSK